MIEFFINKGPIKLDEIINLLNFNDIIRYKKNTSLNNFHKPDCANLDDLSFFYKKGELKNIKSKVILTTLKHSNSIPTNLTVLVSKNIYDDIALLSNIFYRKYTYSEIENLHKPIISENSFIPNNTIIENGVVVGNNFEIGNFSIIGSNCILGNNVTIGNNVSLTNAIVGDNVFIKDGSKIGDPGFGFSPQNNKNNKIFHIGRVIIQNEVSIGSNCTIDRGSFGDTSIGENSYLDNQIHIAHNVTIGANCIIAAQTGIAGSTIIGNNVQIGGQSGIAGHLTIGDNVKVAAKSGVIRNIKKNNNVMGYPAISLIQYLKNYKKLMM